MFPRPDLSPEPSDLNDLLAGLPVHSIRLAPEDDEDDEDEDEDDEA